MNIEIYPISDHPDMPGIKRELVEKFVGDFIFAVPQRAEVQFFINHKTGKADTPAVLDAKGVIVTPAIINSKFRGFNDNEKEVVMVATNARMVDANGVVVYQDSDGNYPLGSIAQYDFFKTMVESGKMTQKQLITMQVGICDTAGLFNIY